MSDEERADTPGPDTAGLAEAAKQVSGDAQKVAEQLADMRRELAQARLQAADDLAAAKEQAEADVAAERRDRRRAGWKFAIVIALDVVLSAVILGLYANQRDTNHRLETLLKQNYTTSQQQAQTRTRVLCPLYEVLLAAASNPAPQATATPEQKSRLEKALTTIRDGYTTLGCQPPLTSG